MGTSSSELGRVDVHQHLVGERLIEALRARTRPPWLDGWTLHLAGEPAYEMDPADHDPERRRADNAALDLALVSLSAALGIETLPPHEATPLLNAYHADATALSAPPPGSGAASRGGDLSGDAAGVSRFGAWASAGLVEIDVDGLAAVLDRGLVGLQLPATALLDAGGYDRCGPLLALLEERGLPLFVHPGAAATPDAPGWWPALVPYVQQMHASWFAFRVYGRANHPRLRVCFALLAGLAPLHGERLVVRGGGRGEVDPLAFVETSSYGPRAVDATMRAIGIDTIVYGSDAPYAPAIGDFRLGAAAEHAIRVANPRHLVLGEE